MTALNRGCNLAHAPERGYTESPPQHAESDQDGMKCLIAHCSGWTSTQPRPETVKLVSLIRTSLGWRMAFAAILLAGICGSGADTPVLALPSRATDAPGGKEFSKRITSLDLPHREEAVFSQIMAGNVPGFLRKLCPVTTTNITEGQTDVVTFYATPDYLAVGSDADYLLIPLSPMTAQMIADRLDCILPTPKMVDDIYRAASVKLAPLPIPPSAEMVTMPVFVQHNEAVHTQRAAFLNSSPLGTLVAGHKKDVVICRQLSQAVGKVAIYGWHRTNGVPIQSLYLGHTVTWVDYSHGIRLVSQHMLLNGKAANVADFLANPETAMLLSHDGVIRDPRYATNQPAATTPNAVSQADRPDRHDRKDPNIISFPDSVPGFAYGEMTRTMTFDPGVRIHINAPSFDSFATNKPVELIFYAVPNGNTIEQTIGKKREPGDDWHFDIQHIGAQTRLLRQTLRDRAIVVAYLEADTKSWPAWRRKHGDTQLPALLDSVKRIFSAYPTEVVLTGHSGGGSLIFGYLNAMERIPDDVERIAFLDSNYAYETTDHFDKLTDWLKSSPQHVLCVLAYHDSIALLNGKTFVSERGGTWGRSHAMLKDFESQFQFTSRTNGDLRVHVALNGRLQFWLMENPAKKILHTVQVERNGFIHAMVIGTSNEGRGYEYFGDRAYTQFIQSQPD